MDRDAETVVAYTTVDRLVLWCGLPVAGAAVGWVLKLLAGWAVTLPWVPLQGPMKLVASIPDPQATVGAIVVGALAGVVLGFIGSREGLTVRVRDDQVTLTRGDHTRTVSGHQVTVVCTDAKQLVLQDETGRELAREQTDAKPDRLRAAFVAHGYSWHDADPHAAAFRPWVEESPDLSSSAHALLGARRRALAKGDKTDARHLREELARLGVVVRDEKKVQYWRGVAADRR